jgi:hypothetical protein
MKKISLLIGIFLLLSFTGCGSSSSSSTKPIGGVIEDNNSDNSNRIGTNNTDIEHDTEIVGRAIDGRLMHSTVFLDLNRNNKFDKGEPKTKTDKNGKYKFTLTSAQKKASKTGYAPIIVNGGIDTGDAKPFKGELKAPLNLKKPQKNVNITPITTILAYNIEETITIERTFTSNDDFDKIVNESKSKISKVLNLNVGVLDADPIAEAEKGNIALIKSSLQIQKSMELSLDIIDISQTDGERGAYNFLYQSFSSTLVTYISNTSIDKIFEKMIDTKLEEKINVAKSKTSLKNKILKMTQSASKLFSIDSFNIIKLSMQLQKIMGYVSIGDFSFDLNSIINMKASEYQLMYNSNILSQYIDISGLTAQQINSFFNGGVASLDDLSKITTDFDGFVSSLNLEGIDIDALRLDRNSGTSGSSGSGSSSGSGNSGTSGSSGSGSSNGNGNSSTSGSSGSGSSSGSGNSGTSGSNGSGSSSGNGNSGTSDNNTNIATIDENIDGDTPIEGTAIDGRLMGSTVFLDLNRNGQWDNGEPKTTTEKNGKYKFTLTSAQKKASKTGYAPIIVMGGIDTATAKPFKGRIRAPLSLRRPKKNVNITSVTTVLAYNIEEVITSDRPYTSDSDFDKIINSAKLKVSSILGLNINLLDANPITEAEKGNTILLKTALQIHKSIELSLDIVDLSKTGGEGGAYSFLYQSFSSTLTSYTSSVGLEKIFDTMIDSKLEDKIDKSKSKAFLKEKILNMITSTSNFFSIGGTFNIIKLSMQFQKVMDYVYIGNFSFDVNSIINMKASEYQLMYNSNILSQYIDISTLTEQQINSFFSGGIATLDALSEITTNFDLFVSHLTLSNININQLKYGDVRKEIKKTLVWDDGYCADVYIKNMGQLPASWELDMNISGKVFNSWNVRITDEKIYTDSNRSTFKVSGANWNKIVSGLGETKFGYCVFNDVVNGKPLEVNEEDDKFEIKKGKKVSWKDGYCEEIRVENNSNNVIDWTINSFDLNNSSYYGYYKSWNITYNNLNIGKLQDITDKNSQGYLLPKRGFYFNYCASSNKNNPFVIDLYENQINNWSGKSTGSCKTSKIRNITANSILNWKLLDYGVVGYTFHTWDSERINSSEHLLSIKGVSSNSHINGWGSTQFGYCTTNQEVTVSNIITAVDKDKEVKYGNCTLIRVKNNEDEAVKWKYDVTDETPIDFANNANMVDNGSNSYTFSGIGWNEILAPSETTSFTYCHGTTRATKIKIGNDTSNISSNGYFETIKKPIIKANSFDEIDDDLSNFYDVSLEVRNSDLVHDGSKDIKVAIVINRFNPNYEDSIDIQLLAIVPITITKQNNLVTIKAQAGSKITLIGRKSNDTFISTSITNESANVKTTTTASGDKSFTISASTILRKFTQASNHSGVGDYIKDIIFKNVTVPHSYDVYVLFSSNTFDDDTPIILDKVDGGRDISYLMRIPEGSEMDEKVEQLMGTDLKGYWGIIDTFE